MAGKAGLPRTHTGLDPAVPWVLEPALRVFPARHPPAGRPVEGMAPVGTHVEGWLLLATTVFSAGLTFPTSPRRQARKRPSPRPPAAEQDSLPGGHRYPWTLPGGRVGTALLPHDSPDAPRSTFGAQWSGKGGAAPRRRPGESGSRGFPGPDLGGRLSASSPGEDSDRRSAREGDSAHAPQGRPRGSEGDAEAAAAAGWGGTGRGGAWRDRPSVCPPEPTAASLPTSASVAPRRLQAPTGSSAPTRLSSLLFACPRQ